MFTSNQEFYQYIIDVMKLPYDTQLLNIISKMFYNAVAELEKQIDFNFQRKVELFSVPKGQSSIGIPYVKSINKVLDKTRNIELIGMPYVEEFLKLSSSTEGIPKHYVYTEGSIKLTYPVVSDTEYVVSYDRYYYQDPTYMDDTALHPIITENPELIGKALKTKIYEYMEDKENLSILYKLTEKQKKDEQATQQLKRYKNSRLIIGLPRY